MDTMEVVRINGAFRPLWELFRAHGSFRVMYAMADLLRIATIEPPRPVLPLSLDIRRHVEAALQALSDAGFLDP
jgi:4-hydroxy-tetrahydrodipicolinate synthase